MNGNIQLVVISDGFAVTRLFQSVVCFSTYILKISSIPLEGSYKCVCPVLKMHKQLCYRHDTPSRGSTQEVE